MRRQIVSKIRFFKYYFY